MKPMGAIRVFFVISGLYDAGLGVAFLLAGPAIFDHFAISQPNHPGYVQFAALLLVIFGLMFFSVAANPSANRNLIPYGILLKLSYSGTVCYYWSSGGVPQMWKPFAVVDLAFLALFAWSYVTIRPPGARGR